ncbi:MAG TPA: hypothetical protein VGM03_12840 [Phycisphaerae bacterium]
MGLYPQGIIAILITLGIGACVARMPVNASREMAGAPAAMQPAWGPPSMTAIDFAPEAFEELWA